MKTGSFVRGQVRDLVRVSLVVMTGSLFPSVASAQGASENKPAGGGAFFPSNVQPPGNRSGTVSLDRPVPLLPPPGKPLFSPTDPMIPQPRNEGGTADLNAADREARKKMDAIQAKYKAELLKDGLPLPDNLDINGDLPPGVMEIIDKLKGEPCEMMNEIKFHLDEKRPRSNTQIVGKVLGIFFLPDESDVFEAIAEKFAKNLLPVVNLYDKLSNAKDIAELIDEEVMANRLHDQYVAAVEAYRASKDWDMGKLNQSVQSLGAERDAKIAEIEKLEYEMRDKLMREYPSAQEISIFGPPFVGRSKVPNDALIWQRYAERIDPIQRQYEAEIRAKLREIAGIEMKKNVLEKFRKPLIEKPCEQCIAEAKQKAAGGGGSAGGGTGASGVAPSPPLIPPPLKDGGGGGSGSSGAAGNSGKSVGLGEFR